MPGVRVPWDGLEAARAAVDVLLVAYLIYRFILLIRDTRALPILSGMLLLVGATAVSRWLGLKTLHWLLQSVQLALLVGLPIVFQPELRRALEQVGRGGLLPRSPVLPEEELERVIDAVAEAARLLSRNRIGAIIVLERGTRLGDIAATGIPVDGLVSAELLVNLFIPRTPLHDGAVIVRGQRIVAAGCFLPLTENPDLDVSLGSRHRAAIGISEHSDALALVVSEETGSVGLAHGGRLIRNLDEARLRDMLRTLLRGEAGAPGGRAWLSRWRGMTGT